MSARTPDSFQLSQQQRDALAADPGGPIARLQAVLAIDGEVAQPAIADSLRAVVRRHESLRTTFVREPGLMFPLQVVNPLLEPRIETLDLSAADPRGREEQMARALRSELEATFDLERGPLVRAILLIEAQNAIKLVVTVSALCADQTSMALLLGEVAGQLGSAELVADPLQYADFSAWQHELSTSDGEEARAARAFWEGLEPASPLVLPFSRPGSGATATEELEVEIGGDLAQALSDQAGQLGASAAACAHAAWHAVLGRFGGAETTAVALLAGERRHPDLAGAVGALSRPVPVRACVAGRRMFAAVLAEVDQARRDALVRQDYAPGGNGGGQEIGFAEYPWQVEQAEGLRVTIERMLRAGAEFGLLLMCGTSERRLKLSIAFDPARYRRETVGGLAHGLVRTLEVVAADPGVALGDVGLLNDDEGARLLREFNGTAAAVPQECAHELIAGRARSAPDRPALGDGQGSSTYAE